MSSSEMAIQGALGHRGDRYPVSGAGSKPRPLGPPLLGRPRRLLRAGGTTGGKEIGRSTISRESLLERARPPPILPRPPRVNRCGMVVKASTKPWPRQLGSSIIRALPPRSQAGQARSGWFRCPRYCYLVMSKASCQKQPNLSNFFVVAMAPPAQTRSASSRWPRCRRAVVRAVRLI